MASYGPQIDQSHGENKLSHIINIHIRFHIQSIYVVLLLNLAEKNICFFCEKIHSSMHHTHTRLKCYNIPSICMCNQMVYS